jgi:hypothetical protein
MKKYSSPEVKSLWNGISVVVRGSALSRGPDVTLRHGAAGLDTRSAVQLRRTKYAIAMFGIAQRPSFGSFNFSCRFLFGASHDVSMRESWMEQHGAQG